MTDQPAPDPILQPGAAEPLGATPDGHGVNFAVYSSTAQKVELCLFDGKAAETRIALPARTGDVWHGYVPGLAPGQVYGFRCDGGPLVLDPYAREIAGALPFGRVAPPLPPAAAADTHMNTPWKDTVIYEAHLRGMTMEFPGVPEELRGRGAGLASDAVIAHLKKQGVTAIELLPVEAFQTEQSLVRSGLQNYWGYNTIGFFAPEPRYFPAQAAEFRAMVDRLHAAGIEVILDVVYNHTGEGGGDGKTLSFRGIDDKTYYRHDPAAKDGYVDWTGCGNTVDMTQAPARKLVLDSLRYWAQEMGVDGFRFDLAPVLGREGQAEDHGVTVADFSRCSEFFQDVRRDPVLSKLKMIAEPWDLHPSCDKDGNALPPARRGYQLGNFPAGVAEWNDRFRDTTRAFWRGDEGMAKEMATCLAGSKPTFGGKSDSPAVSVNFVAIHDGPTAADLSAYQSKHNEANGENNRDGSDNTFSCNYGVEGPTGDLAVNQTRARHTRNLLTTLFLAHGTPMALGGDECGNSQHGNNNAYCQDNQTGWINWNGPQARELEDFSAALHDFRRAHPALHPEKYMVGAAADAHGVPDIEWFAPSGHEQRNQDWETPWARCFGEMLNDGAVPGSDRSERLYILFNAHSGSVPCALPALKGGELGWQRVLDTSQPALRPGADETVYKPGTVYHAPDRSVTVFMQKPG